jgi:hypothetical protein
MNNFGKRVSRNVQVKPRLSLSLGPKHGSGSDVAVETKIYKIIKSEGTTLPQNVFLRTGQDPMAASGYELNESLNPGDVYIHE